MKEQKVVMTNDEKEINKLIEIGWVVVNMIPMSITGGHTSHYNGKVCFLLEKIIKN